MSISTVNLFVNVQTKTLVSVNGSPTSFPPQFYGDKPTFAIYPVIPNGANANNGYSPFSLTGYTMNLTLAGAPNAASPPTPFAAVDSMVWVPNSAPAVPGQGGYFIGMVDLTQPAVGTFLTAASAAAATATAYFNFDVFDSLLERTTLIQATFTLNASIDTVNAGPPVNVPSYPTLAQLLNTFVAIAAFPGKFIEFESPDGTKKKAFSCRNDGSEGWDTIS
jgi:hypothetical protein